MYDILSGNSRALDEAGRARIDSWMEQKEIPSPPRAHRLHRRPRQPGDYTV